MFADLEQVGGSIDVISLRGTASGVDHIERILLELEPRTYSLVIVDPLYKTYPAEFDENSNAQMTALYRRWERMAEHLDCGMWIVHHGTKGSQAEKRIVDVGAGASAQSRSADAHIALREHETPDCVVLEARVRSFAPIDPMVLRWQYPLWHSDLGLNAADLKTGRRPKSSEQPAKPTEPEPEPWTPERFVASFASQEPRERKTIIARATTSGVSGRKAEALCQVALADGLLHRWTVGSDRRVIRLATVEQPAATVVEEKK